MINIEKTPITTDFIVSSVNQQWFVVRVAQSWIHIGKSTQIRMYIHLKNSPCWQRSCYIRLRVTHAALPLSLPPFLSRRRYRLTSWMLVLMVGPLGTLPGVMLGSFSGSMFWRPFHGTPGQNSEEQTTITATYRTCQSNPKHNAVSMSGSLPGGQLMLVPLEIFSLGLLPWPQLSGGTRGLVGDSEVDMRL